MITIRCTDVYQSTFQDQPCTIVVGSLPKQPKATIASLGELTSASQSPDVEVQLGNDLRSQLPVPPVRVLIENSPQTICLDSPHYEAIEMYWGDLVLSVVLPSRDIPAEKLLHRELRLFGQGESIGG